MKRVLIATFRAGGGHESVAQALRSALGQLYTDHLAVTVADPFDGQRPSPVGRLMQLYAPIIVRWPSLWGMIYRLTDRAWLLKGGVTLGGLLSGPGACHLLEATQPDVVVSVHPLCHHLLARALRRAPHPVPMVAVLTDLVCVHAAWSTPSVDLYLAPTDETEGALQWTGVHPDRIRVVGLPVDPRFGGLDPDPVPHRRRLGLDEHRLTLLLAGGGEGAGGLEQVTLAISHSGLPVQLLVVCGRNGRLEHRLRERKLEVPAHILGFVNNMPELMAAADVIVTKAGSVSLGEAMACGRPVLIIKAIPGQETGNLEFVESRGAGKSVPTTERLLEALGRLSGEPGALAAMAARARAAGQPGAAHAAATEIVRCASLAAVARPLRRWAEGMSG